MFVKGGTQSDGYSKTHLMINMNFRTDLALEQKEYLKKDVLDGVLCETFKRNSSKITRIKVINETGEKTLGKPMGSYVTVETDSFSKCYSIADERMETVRDELIRLLPEEGSVLVAGLGNMKITPDALGPKCSESIFATRHLKEEFAQKLGLGNLRPGVLGQTGVETGETIAGAVRTVAPSAVIVIDALAARRLSRLGCTVQIATCGIIPGSGVGNARAEISENTLGVPVISIGIPTVVDAATLAYDIINDSKGSDTPELQHQIEPHSSMMMITPKEIDIMIERASKFLSMAINCALQPTLSAQEIMELTS